MKKKISLFLVCLFILPMIFSCATPWQNKATSVYLGGATLVTTTENTIKPSCDQAIIAADKCAQLQVLYGKIRAGCIAAGNTLILALVTTDPVQQKNLLDKYNTLMTNTQVAVASYIDFYNKIQSQDQGKLKFTMTPEMLALIVNAFLALVQAIPAIISAVGSLNLSTVDVNALMSQIQAAQASLPVW